MSYSNIRSNISYKINLSKETGLNNNLWYPMVIVNETITGETDKSDFARIQGTSDTGKLVGCWKYGSCKNGEVGTITTQGVIIMAAGAAITAGQCLVGSNTGDTYKVIPETQGSSDHSQIGIALETVKNGDYVSILLQL